MKNVPFFNRDYADLELPHGALVYCDIPYKGTTKYTTGDFNHSSFYGWCKHLESLGHAVYVSEYAKNVPEGATVVFSIKSKQDIRNKENKRQETEEVVFRFL